MGVRVVDCGREDRAERCDWWNWRPTVELLRAAGLLDEAQAVTLDLGVGEVSREQARAFARFLDERVFPALRPDDRIMLDGQVTAEPDDGTFHREPSERGRNYSASGDWLRRLAALCRECDGFVVR